MALRRKLTKAEFDALTANKELYKETDGAYLLDIDGDDSEARIAALKTSLDKAYGERDETKKQLRAIAEQFKDIDPAKARDALTKIRELDEQTLLDKGEFDTLKKQLLDQHENEKKQLLEKHVGEVKTRDDRIGKLTSALERRLVDAEATTAIAEAKGAPILLLPHVRSQIKVVEEDGEFIAKVVDGQGNPRIGDAAGKPMSIPQLVDEMKKSDQYARAFDASGAGGSGAPSTHGSSGGARVISANDQAALNNNLADIASGKAVVAPA
jgi:hypothetical protein